MDSDNWIDFAASGGGITPDCATIVDATDSSKTRERSFFMRLSLPCKGLIDKVESNRSAANQVTSPSWFTRHPSLLTNGRNMTYVLLTL